MGKIKGFELANFRVFKENTRFEFAPVTIVTGKNNSGKSAILKGLQLLKDNLIEGEHLWSLNLAGSGIKTGGFSNICNYNSTSKFVVFKIPVGSQYFQSDVVFELTYINNSSSPERSGTLYSFRIMIENIDLVTVYHYCNDSGEVLSVDEIDKGTNLYGSLFFINFSYFKEMFDLLWESKNIILKPEKEYSDKAAFDAMNIFSGVSDMNDEHQIWLDEANFGNNIFKSFYNQFHSSPDFKIDESFKKDESLLFNYFNSSENQTNSDSCFINDGTNASAYLEFFQNAEKKILKKLSFEIGLIVSMPDEDLNSSLEKTLLNLINNRYSLRIIPELVIKEFEKKEKKKCKSINNPTTYGQCFFTRYVDLILIDIFKNFKGSLNDLHFLEAARGLQDRSFHDEMDRHFFPRLLKEYAMVGFSPESSRKVFLDKWIKKFGFGDSIDVVRDSEARLTSLYISRDGHKLSLADLGNGVAQLIPILMQIALISQKSCYQAQESHYVEFFHPTVLFIEEPETSLHPSLQSLLAEMFIDAGKTFNIQFIIETHSEYLIRKFQLSVAEKKITPRDCTIYYVHDPLSVAEESKLVETINILEDGSLTASFGQGFFDEAINLKIEILKLKNQKN